MRLIDVVASRLLFEHHDVLDELERDGHSQIPSAEAAISTPVVFMLCAVARRTLVSAAGYPGVIGLPYLAALFATVVEICVASFVVRGVVGEVQDDAAAMIVQSCLQHVLTE